VAGIEKVPARRNTVSEAGISSLQLRNGQLSKRYIALYIDGFVRRRLETGPGC
jgi:hypothetical protein